MSAITLRRSDAGDVGLVERWIDSLEPVRPWIRVPATFDRCTLRGWCRHRRTLAGTSTAYCTQDAGCHHSRPTTRRSDSLAYPTHHERIIFARNRTTREVIGEWKRQVAEIRRERGLLEAVAIAHGKRDFAAVAQLTAVIWPGMETHDRIMRAKRMFAESIAAGADARFRKEARCRQAARAAN